jgi:hypothetical protein
MAKTLRIKRRRTGTAGPPASLLNAELAFNEVSGVLYYGAGLTTNNAATTIIAIGGSGAFTDLTSAQTISGAKTFDVSPYAPTPSVGDNSTKVATTAFVKAQNYAWLVDGLIPSILLPSYVDDVLEYGSIYGFPSGGETGKIYVAKSTNKTYRWSGSQYIEISALGGIIDGGLLELSSAGMPAEAAAILTEEGGMLYTEQLARLIL